MTTTTVQFSNFASTTLVGTYGTGDTALTVTSAASFPIVSGGTNWFYAVITDSLTAPTKREIVKVTNVSGSIFTVVRAQDSSSAQTWANGSYIELRVVNKALQDLFDEAVSDATSTVSSLTSTGDINITFDSDNNGAGTFNVLSGADTVLQVTNTGELIASPGYANIKDFGGDATGASDNSAAFNAAIAAGYTAVYFPKGTYRFTTGISTTNQNLRIFGDGPQISVLKITGAASFTFLTFTGRYRQFVTNQLIVDNVSIQNAADSGTPAGSAIKAVMNATYVLKADITGAIAVGNTIVGATSGASGVVLDYDATDGWIELDAGMTGTWDDNVGGSGNGETINISGSPVATVEDGAGAATHYWKQPYSSVIIDKVEIGNLVHDACFIKGIELDTCQMAKISNCNISGFMSQRYPNGTREAIGIDIYSRYNTNMFVKGTDINITETVIYQADVGIQVNNNATATSNYTEGVHINGCTILNCFTGVKIGDSGTAPTDGLPGWFIEGSHITAADIGIDFHLASQGIIENNLIYGIGGTTFSAIKIVGPITSTPSPLEADLVISDNTLIKAATYSGNSYGVKFEGGDATPGNISCRVSNNSFQAFTYAVITDANTTGVRISPDNQILSGGTYSIAGSNNIASGFSQDVGIGRTPLSRFDVYDATGDSVISSESGNGAGALSLKSSGTNAIYHYFYNATGERVRIAADNSGNLTFYSGSAVTQTLQISTNGIGLLNDRRIYFANSTNTGNAVLQMYTDNIVYFDNPYGDFHIRSGTGGSLTNSLFFTNDGRLYGTKIHNNAGAVTGTTNQYIASGTYTPTPVNTTNVASSSCPGAQWIRVGNVVTVSGLLNIDPTAAGAVFLGIPLPIASNFTSDYQLGGTAAISNNGIAGEVAAIAGDVANDRALLNYRAVDTGNNGWTFTFTYVVV